MELKCSFFGSVPLGQYLPCLPCSESRFDSDKNYRYLKLHKNETGCNLLARIQKMQEVDKAVVGFIIGSTLISTDELPADVCKELSQLDQGKGNIPPLIVLKTEGYDQLQSYTMSHYSSVKKVKCLSDVGSKFMNVTYVCFVIATAGLCVSCCLDYA